MIEKAKADETSAKLIEAEIAKAISENSAQGTSQWALLVAFCTLSFAALALTPGVDALAALVTAAASLAIVDAVRMLPALSPDPAAKPVRPPLRFTTLGSRFACWVTGRAGALPQRRSKMSESRCAAIDSSALAPPTAVVAGTAA